MPPIAQITHHKPLVRIAIVIAYVQFTYALEYMMFNPVFAFMAADFSVPVSYAGYVSAIYTSGAVLSGLLAFYWIDFFNKKRFLIVNMALLSLLTALIMFSSSFGILLTLRLCAGLVGGAVMGAGTGILINHAPLHLRGKMLATVIASFSMVSIAGMPAILFICTYCGWHMALGLISILCLLAVPLIIYSIPPDVPSAETLCRPSLNVNTLLFASGNALVQFSPMLIIPVLVPLMTQFLGASPGMLPWLFFVGGVAGYLAAKMTGILTAHLSALLLGTVSTGVFILSLLMPVLGGQHAAVFIILFLGSSYSRLVSSSVVTIEYPNNRQRAGFASLQTSIMYLMTSVAFFLSSYLFPHHSMTPKHINTLLIVSAVSASVFPVMIIILRKKLAKRTTCYEHVMDD